MQWNLKENEVEEAKLVFCTRPWEEEEEEAQRILQGLGGVVPRKSGQWSHQRHGSMHVTGAWASGPFTACPRWQQKLTQKISRGKLFLLSPFFDPGPSVLSSQIPISRKSPILAFSTVVRAANISPLRQPENTRRVNLHSDL
jgi:hypothetical protein